MTNFTRAALLIALLAATAAPAATAQQLPVAAAEALDRCQEISDLRQVHDGIVAGDLVIASDGNNAIVMTTEAFTWSHFWGGVLIDADYSALVRTVAARVLASRRYAPQLAADLDRMEAQVTPYVAAPTLPIYRTLMQRDWPVVFEHVDGRREEGLLEIQNVRASRSGDGSATFEGYVALGDTVLRLVHEDDGTRTKGAVLWDDAETDIGIIFRATRGRVLYVFNGTYWGPCGPIRGEFSIQNLDDMSMLSQGEWSAVR